MLSKVSTREALLAVIFAILLMTYLWITSYLSLHSQNEVLLQRHLELHRVLFDVEQALSEKQKDLEKRDELLSALFGKQPAKHWLTMGTTITWYSLSEEECDEDPDTAAHGKSRPFMAAISMHVVDALNLTPGDRIAVLSDDGEVAAVVVYWDQKNPRYDDGSWVDIVAPSKKVAARWSIRPGRIVKL